MASVLSLTLLAFAPGNLSEAAMSSLMLAFLAPLSFGISIAILTDKLHNLSPMQRLTGFATGAAAGVCPTTEADLGDGIFKAESWLGAGGVIEPHGHEALWPTSWLQAVVRMAAAAGLPWRCDVWSVELP